MSTEHYIAAIAVAAVGFLAAITWLHRRALGRAERCAAASEELLTALPEALVVFDQQGAIVRVNKNAEQLFGRCAKDLVERPLETLFGQGSGRQRVAWHHGLSRLRVGRLDACELEAVRADGSLLPVQVRTRCVEQAGSQLFVASVRDLSAQQQMKSALQRYIGQLVATKDSLRQHNEILEREVRQQTAELSIAKCAAESANSAKSEFLSNMSHELRTPLHAILSFSRFGMGRFESDERTKLLTYFQRIQSTGQTLLRLLNQLLDLAKLEAGAVTMRSEPVHVVALLHGVREEFAALAREKSITMHVDSPADDDMVWGDAEKLAQVMRNLLGNALKFSPPGGSVEIRLLAEGERLAMYFRDTGPGIPDEECAAVFEKFVQSHTTKNGAGGTGLGLSICREIVARHQGTIVAEPTHGQGASIRVELPRCAARGALERSSAELSAAIAN